MKKEQFLKKLNKKYAKFEKLHYEIVNLVNNYLEDEKNLYSVDTNYDLRNIEQLCFTYAWVVDRLNNVSGVVDSKTYKKSMTKKIRKALSYTK